jgi:hypothetical protein
MGKKGNDKGGKAKMTKKEKKVENHLKLVQGKKGSSSPGEEWNKNEDKKKAA